MGNIYLCCCICFSAALTNAAYIAQLNEWGKNRLPFFFLIDFELEQPQAWPAHQLPADILFDFEGFTNATDVQHPVFTEKSPVTFESYKKKFDFVHQQIRLGNSFLVNLTEKTGIFTASGLRDIFFACTARYKLLYGDHFVVFSPETFIRIANGVMTTCPMKGTIDASLPEAEARLLADQKELAEHVTVVDLLRNDMSRFCRDVRVENFRYTEKIFTQGKDLIQTSSKIRGKLPADYAAFIGDILFSMLPAGSVSGAPKPKTCEIIRQAEGEKRGYYTGVAGYFDGENLNSCVLIRFIERVGNSLYYRSGGGITAQSTAWQEYQELIDKVYVPTAGVYQSSWQ